MKNVVRIYLILSCLVISLFSISMQAQTNNIDVKIQYLSSDDLTWGVFMKSSSGFEQDSRDAILVTGQVTLFMRNNGQDDLLNIKSENGRWSSNYIVAEGPVEAPDLTYFSVYLPNSANITLENEEEILLFTFQSSSCPDTIGLIDNNKDAFAISPNSLRTNPGIDLSLLNIKTGIFHNWNSNYAPYAASCRDCDQDGIVDALEDTNGDGMFTPNVDASDLCDNENELDTPPSQATQRACITVNDVSFTSPSECGEADGSITVDAVHEFGNPLQYSLDGGRVWVNSSTISNLEAGVIYRLELRDFLGLCFESYGNIELEHPECNTDPCITDPFSVTDYPDQNICAGGGVTLNVAGGEVYDWSPALGLSATNTANPTANPTTTTTYTVTVTNGDGCTATDDITINVSENPTANAGSDVSICAGSNTTLNASGGSTYQWSPTTGLSNSSIANPIVNPTTTTTYTVTVSNANGCTATDNVTINVPESVIANAGSDVFICAGSNTILNASGGSTYQWSPTTGLSNLSIANPIANPTNTTTYTVTVSNANGCTATDNITVNVPESVIANAGSDATICAGSSTTLNATGGNNYQWSPATGLSNPSIANPIANPTSTTTYSVTVSNADGCNSVDQVVVGIAASLTINAGADMMICPDEATPLNVSGGSSYQWSPAEGLSSTTVANPTVTISTAATYCVTVTDANGCSGSDCIAIQIDTGCELDEEDDGEGTGNTVNNCIDGPIVLACQDKVICPTGETQLVVNGGIRWEWTPATGLDNPFSPIPIASPSVTTTYTVTGWDENDCFATEEVLVTVDPNRSCDATPPPCFGDLIPEEKMCIGPTENSVDICLAFSEEDQTKYTISVDGNVPTVVHGCSFEALISYQYNVLPNQIDNYKIKSWQINDTYYSGVFNTIEELATWMQSTDPTGNWKMVQSISSITGGNTASIYDALIITQQSTTMEIGLLPNMTQVPTGTLIQVDMTGKDSEILTVVEVATSCTEEILIERCN